MGMCITCFLDSKCNIFLLIKFKYFSSNKKNRPIAYICSLLLLPKFLNKLELMRAMRQNIYLIF